MTDNRWDRRLRWLYVRGWLVAHVVLYVSAALSNRPPYAFATSTGSTESLLFGSAAGASLLAAVLPWDPTIRIVSATLALGAMMGRASALTFLTEDIPWVAVIAWWTLTMHAMMSYILVAALSAERRVRNG